MNKLLLTALACATATLQAAPLPAGDARSFAMGGTGTAASHPNAAAILNPALMSLPQPSSRDNFGLSLQVGAIVAADNELVDDVDAFQNSNVWDKLDQAIQDFNNLNDGSPTKAQIDAALDKVIAAGEEADRLLLQIDRDALRADLQGSLALVIPRGQGISFGVFADTSVEASGIARYEDSPLIRSIISTAKDIQNNTKPSSTDLADLGSTPQSNGEALVLALTEVGFALSRPVTLGGQTWYLGASPKVLNIRTFDYKADVNTFDDSDFDANDYESNTSTFNLDLGAARTFGPDGDLVVGFSVKNLIPKDVETKRGRKVSIDPVARVGVALNRATWTVTGDLELLKTKRAGFEGDKQYLRLGAEWAPVTWFALRAGVAHNLASDNAESDSIASTTQGTAGLAFSVLGMGLDITGAMSDKDVGGSVQLTAVY